MNKNIKERVIGILFDMTSRWDIPPITEQSNLRSDLSFESLDILDLTLKVEIVFNIKIRPEEISKVIYVFDLIELVKSKL